jgi:hypothetical protein
MLIFIICGRGFPPLSFNFAAGSRSHNQLNFFFPDNLERMIADYCPEKRSAASRRASVSSSPLMGEH